MYSVHACTSQLCRDFFQDLSTTQRDVDNGFNTSSYIMYMYMYTYTCLLLLSNQHFKGPYLEAEVVEEVIGWLG